jgi:NhaP-type Na+/H+ or K+/H+ antiporter
MLKPLSKADDFCKIKCRTLAFFVSAEGGNTMLFSLSLIILLGFTLSGIFNRFKIPGIIAMIITGIILGPYNLNLVSQDILNISPELRKIALIVILLRAGLTLDLEDLKKVGRPALLLSFIPASLEILSIYLLAPIFFNISNLEAAILGTVVAAVSPAVVVPRMITLIERKYGDDKKIPQLIMAAASVDDIYVIILFTSFMSMSINSNTSVSGIISLPISIILGVFIGVLSGILLVWLFKKIHMRDTIKVLIILSASFLIVSLEDFAADYIPISGLLSVMFLGITILKSYKILAKRIMGKFSKIWVAAELLLFVLVGAAVDISYIYYAGILAFALIFFAVLSRVVGVNISLIGTDLNLKEKLFCSISYLPKATVQAAIGAIPLTAGISSGNLILSIAVLSIIITAPVGAFGIDGTYKKLLYHEKQMDNLDN